jgi:hypothetical protein
MLLFEIGPEVGSKGRRTVREGSFGHLSLIAFRAVLAAFDFDFVGGQDN